MGNGRVIVVCHVWDFEASTSGEQWMGYKRAWHGVLDEWCVGSSDCVSTEVETASLRKKKVVQSGGHF